jgi:NAD(P)H-dependent flavin oxidoreductase YrpB (nitropropane dioxygenase family)
MNTVSDAKLAVAVRRSGGYPSFVGFDGKASIMSLVGFDLSNVIKEITEYRTEFNDSDFIMGVSSAMVAKSPQALAKILDIKPAYLELYDVQHINEPSFISAVETLHRNGTRVLLKLLSSAFAVKLFQESPDVFSAVDGFIIKGPKSAGRVSLNEADLIEEIKSIRNLSSTTIIVAQGGIHDSAGIIECITAGATIVSLGTIFAVSAESSVSLETKNKMIESSYNDTVKIGQSNQNGLMFTKTAVDIENNTIGLRSGVSTGKQGHVFAGGALDFITDIKPVDEIMQNLVKGL